MLPGGFKGFLSLKWKIIAPLSLVLVIVNASLAYVTFDSQREQLQTMRADSETRSERLAAEVVDQLGTQLATLANLIPNLEEVRNAIARGDTAALQRHYQRYWGGLRLDTDLEQVLFFDVSGHLLTSWSDGGVAQNDAALPALARQVIAEERPQRLLACATSCLYYYLVPVLNQGRSVAVVAVAASLADAVLSFRRVTGADIALLAPYQPEAKVETEQPLSVLGGRLLAATGGSTSVAILQHIDPGSATGKRLSAQYQGRHYDILPLPLPIAVSTSSPSLLVLLDRTESIQALRNAAWRGIIFGGIGLLLSELILLALLWAPMQRLHRTSNMLPLLGQGRFERVRAGLAQAKSRSMVKDELDILEAGTFELADRLADLQQKNAAHTQELDGLVRQLSRERDFVAGLLDTAQMLILTQDRQGRILMVNAYVLALTGYDYVDLRGASMTDYFSTPEQAEDTRQALATLLRSEATNLRQETRLRCKNGELRDVVWIHSSLGAQNPEDAAILSVGLDITELHRVEKQASYLAEYDALTGLYNHHRFQEKLQAILLHSSSQSGGALIYIDLDEFKSLNDTTGHEAADNVLCAVAHQLQALLPAPALTGRLGGDDFSLVYPGLDAAHATQLARHIQHSLASIALAEIPPSYKVSACIGIALFPEHGTVAQALLANADLALFRAKENGRGSVHLYAPDEGLMERVLNRVHWVDRIEQALAHDQLELHFQPILALADDTISHYEVLVRMRDSAGALHAPDEFIGVAEATGLIRGIDRMVLQKAVRVLAQLQQDYPGIKLAVNLSGRSFGDPLWLELLHRELAHSGVAPASLIFEITETAAVEDLAAARALMARVIELGCAFSLDDFGVGFASFDYLKQLPVEYVKIDGSFIRNLAHSQDDQIFVQALVQAARGFGKKTVAEGDA